MRFTRRTAWRVYKWEPQWRSSVIATVMPHSSMNPYEASATIPDVEAGGGSRWLYIPAWLCWIGCVTFLAIFGGMGLVAARTAMTVNGNELIALCVIAIVFSLTTLTCAYGCYRAGRRSLQGRWKSALAMTLGLFLFLYLIAFLIVTFIRTYFPSE